MQSELFLDPLPPPPDGAPAWHHLPCRLAYRLPDVQPLQNRLLALPPILAPWRQTRWQARARTPARRAKEPRNDQQTQRQGQSFTPRRVAFVVAMMVQARLSTARTTLGLVGVTSENGKNRTLSRLHEDSSRKRRFLRSPDENPAGQFCRSVLHSRKICSFLSAKPEEFQECHCVAGTVEHHVTHCCA
jgi:hypothetical protein